MPGIEDFYTDITVYGKIKINYTVPNSAGTVLTYNASTKEISTRTNSQFISDLDLATNTSANTNFVKKSGDTLTGGGTIDSFGNITVQQSAVGLNATGTFWKTIDDSNVIGGVGALTQDGNLMHMFIGWGISPWNLYTGLNISNTAFTYKGYTVWTAENFNPATKLNADEKAVTLGFTNSDTSAPPYIYHSDGGYVFLATNVSVAQNYALRTGSNATGSWVNAAYALPNNPFIPGRIKNASGDTNLITATHGDVMGMINVDGLSNGNPTNEWYHRIKMLHNNGAGFYTEIFIRMQGGNAMYYSKLDAGVFSGFIRVWDSDNLSNPARQTDLANFIINAIVLSDGSGSGDVTRFTRKDTSTFDVTRLGTCVIDTRIQNNGLGSTGDATYVPKSNVAGLNNKLLPLFHITNRGWSSSLIIKGWTNDYRAWRITGPADITSNEQDIFVSQTKSSDGSWLSERKIWTDRHFTQNDIDNWNSSTNIPFDEVYNGGTDRIFNTDSRTVNITVNYATPGSITIEDMFEFQTVTIKNISTSVDAFFHVQSVPAINVWVPPKSSAVFYKNSLGQIELVSLNSGYTAIIG